MKKKVTLFILLIFKVYISLVDFFHIWNLLNVLIKMAKKILIWAFLHVTIGIQIGEILLPTVQKEECVVPENIHTPPTEDHGNSEG